MAIESALAALGSAIQSTTNMISAHNSSKADRRLVREQNEINRNFNAEQSELAYQRQVEQWHRQNEYDSVANQMSRYAAAGINPNMVYGNQNNAASLPSVSAASASSPGIPASRPVQYSFMDAIRNYQDLRMQDLQAQELQAQIATQEALADKYGSEAANLRERTSFDIESKDLRLLLLKLGVPEKRIDIALKEVDKLIKEEEKKQIGLVNEGLGYQNEYTVRTLEPRIQQVSLANLELIAKRDYLKSQKSLTDEQKKELEYTNFLLGLQSEVFATRKGRNLIHHSTLYDLRRSVLENKLAYYIATGQIHNIGKYENSGSLGRSVLDVLGWNPYRNRGNYHSTGIGFLKF